ncbi:MAG: sodium:calcium antiporter [Candidatus Limnocylindrales bacterium]
MTIILLVVAFILILAGAELFTNGVEWLGRQLGLGEGAVGSVLAAVGTALPETMIPLVAIVFGAGSHSDAVGVGAILGAPFMLATLAMFVTGLAVTIRARSARRSGPSAFGSTPPDDLLRIDPAILGRDVGFFFVIYLAAIGVAFLPAELDLPRWIVAVILIGAYVRYVSLHLGAEAPAAADDLEPLRLRRADRGGPAQPEPPRPRIVVGQVLLALAGIVGGAIMFVGAVETIARSVGLDETLLSLVIAPIATELPEKLNSVIWVGRGKDTLALGNITGAMVFQAAIPTSIALLFASSQWSIGSGSWIAFASAGVALASTALIFVPMIRTGRLHGRGLLLGGVFYVIQLGLVGASLAGLVAA